MGISNRSFYRIFGNKIEDYINKDVNCDVDIKNADWIKIKELLDKRNIQYDYIISYSKDDFDLPEDNCYLKILMKDNKEEKFHDVEHLLEYLEK